MIQLSGVSKRYPGGQDALKSVTLNVERGQFVILTGHSGAGKSTLLKLVAAIETPTQGSIVIGGQNLAALRRRAIPFLRRNFGLIFQDHKLLYDRSVFENAALPLRIAGFDPRETGKRVRAALDKVGLLDRERSNPITLSGGEQQRLCIARAIVHRPAVLLADEPTGNLDSDYAREIVALFGAFHQVGVTLMIATHDPDLFAPLRPRVAHLKQGELQT